MNLNTKQPLVGIGVLIQRPDGKVLLGLRSGTHGVGEWAFPGGWLDYGEKIFVCGVREAKEEVDLDVEIVKVISIADQLRYIADKGFHVVNIGLLARYLGGEPKLLEPDKCVRWEWFDLDKLPENLFEGTELTLKSFKAKQVDANCQ
ncbi:MAG: NUDIX domain-containing protein [Patescibacteria group bacterium]